MLLSHCSQIPDSPSPAEPCLYPSRVSKTKKGEVTNVVFASE